MANLLFYVDLWIFFFWPNLVVIFLFLFLSFKQYKKKKEIIFHVELWPMSNWMMIMILNKKLNRNRMMTWIFNGFFLLVSQTLFTQKKNLFYISHFLFYFSLNVAPNSALEPFCLFHYFISIVHLAIVYYYYAGYGHRIIYRILCYLNSSITMMMVFKCEWTTYSRLSFSISYSHTILTGRQTNTCTRRERDSTNIHCILIIIVICYCLNGCMYVLNNNNVVFKKKSFKHTCPVHVRLVIVMWLTNIIFFSHIHIWILVRNKKN